MRGEEGKKERDIERMKRHARSWRWWPKQSRQVQIMVACDKTSLEAKEGWVTFNFLHRPFFFILLHSLLLLIKVHIPISCGMM